ncbi:PaaI family thioesterase [uncultured Jatrophihabitans sp.]|uniref:PaaI family thioesterase n=1 Tax=uncultured Jatrophihabitans sp. TaxID=1610747 RepID=UPI0035C97C41
MDDERTRTFTWDDPMHTAAAAQGRTGLEFIQGIAAGEIPAPPIARLMNFAVEAAEAGRCVFTVEPAEYHFNPIGSVHGGVYATLLDSALGCAVQTMLPEGVGYTSLDLSVKFLGAARLGAGMLRCTGTVTHLGRRTALAEARIEDAAGRLLSTGTSSCLILSG